VPLQKLDKVKFKILGIIAHPTCQPFCNLPASSQLILRTSKNLIHYLKLLISYKGGFAHVYYLSSTQNLDGPYYEPLSWFMIITQILFIVEKMAFHQYKKQLERNTNSLILKVLLLFNNRQLYNYHSMCLYY